MAHVGSGSPPRWEYRVERHFPSDAPSHGESRGSGLSGLDRLHSLGGEGWELVGVVSFGLPYELVFKRPSFDEPKRSTERKPRPRRTT